MKRHEIYSLGGMVAKDSQAEMEMQTLTSRMAALEQLLEVYEKTVLEQTDKLYEEIAIRKQAEEALQRSEASFRGLLESAPDGVVIVNADHEILMVNEQVERMFGYAREEILGKRVELMIPLRFERHREYGKAYLGAPRRRFMGQGVELYALRKDGSEFPVEISLSPLEKAEGIIVSAAVRDVTVRQEATEKIIRYTREVERANAELKTLHEVSQAISRTLDLDELLREILHALVKTEIFPFEIRAAIFLVEEGKIRLASFVSLSETEVEPCREIQRGECLCGQAVETVEIVVSSNTGEDGRYAICHPVTDPHGRIIVPLEAVSKVVGLLSLYTRPGTQIDENLLRILSSLGSQIGIAINNARLHQEAINYSLHDPLTGLANRRFLEIQLGKSFGAVRRYGEKLSVIMFDIDHFKLYNDTHGHLEGDRLLAKIGAILLKELRTVDYLFRYGGEEFLALIPETDLPEACEAAERLRAAVETGTAVTISLGVAAYRNTMPDKETLIAGADAALYRAKQNGRNRVETFS